MPTLPTTRTVVAPALNRSFSACTSMFAEKHPGSTEDFTLDLSPLAGDTSDKPASVSVSAIAGLTIADRGATLPSLVLRIGGGALGTRYAILILVTMESGAEIALSLYVTIKQLATRLLMVQGGNEYFAISWANQIGDLTITASAWSGALAFANQSFDDDSATAQIAAGAPYQYGSVTNTVTLSSGETKAYGLNIYCQL